MEKAKGSIPFSSTSNACLERPAAGWSLAGFVAGEGYFTVTRQLPPHRNGDPRLRFVFGIQVAERDRPLLEQLRAAIGCGSVTDRQPRREAWQPTSALTVSSRLSHRTKVIPFMDRHLLPGHKRHQFELWVAAMDAYELIHPSRWGRGPSACKVDGCDRPVRGRGLCRSHYHLETGY